MKPGKRVLITRAPQQGSELAERLRALGLEPVLIPAIETVAPGSFAALDRALGHLDSFDWLLFTSANAVEAFAQRLAPAPPAMPAQAARLILPPTLKLAAIGPSTARALEKLGLAPDLVPPKAIAESLTQALLPQAHKPDGAPTRFLLVRAEEAREHLPETLRGAGAEVVVAPAYRTAIPSGSVETLRELFAGPAKDAVAAVTFTSSSTARNLLTLCEAAAVTLPEVALRISIGPITSQTLRDLSLPPHAEAPEATVVSLAETVLRALSI